MVGEKAKLMCSYNYLLPSTVACAFNDLVLLLEMALSETILHPLVVVDSNPGGFVQVNGNSSRLGNGRGNGGDLNFANKRPVSIYAARLDVAVLSLPEGHVILDNG